MPTRGASCGNVYQRKYSAILGAWLRTPRWIGNATPNLEPENVITLKFSAVLAYRMTFAAPVQSNAEPCNESPYYVYSGSVIIPAARLSSLQLSLGGGNPSSIICTKFCPPSRNEATIHLDQKSISTSRLFLLRTPMLRISTSLTTTLWTNPGFLSASSHLSTTTTTTTM